jgi:GNAT superfamily N-acetyltransferase
MAKIRIRRATDLDACVATLRAVHLADGYPMNWPADPRAWLDPPGTRAAWVAVDGAAVAGHALVTTDGELSRLFVGPSRRGGGLAQALIGAARAAAGGRLVLEVANEAASAFYEHTGWAPDGTMTADWTSPDGSPVTLRRYVLSG